MTGEGVEPFPAQIPDWLHPTLAQAARISFECMRRPLNPDNVALLVRLTVDPRMRKVWSQLMRRQRSNGQFFYPAKPYYRGDLSEEELQLRNEEELQLLNMAALVTEVRGYIRFGPGVRVRRDVESIRNYYHETACRLRASLELLRDRSPAWDLPPPIRTPHLAELRSIATTAAILDKLADEEGTGPVVLVDRGRGANAAHALAVSIARLCCQLFGSPLFAVTATLASVALDREVRPRKVRYWWETSQRSAAQRRP